MNKLINDLYDLLSLAKQESEPNRYDNSEEYKELFYRLENALRLIDNTEPSKALKELELVENWIRDTELGISRAIEPSSKISKQALVIEPSLNIIKQYILKAQEQEVDIIHYKGTVDNLRRDNAILKDIKNDQEKVLKIIFEKNVDILELRIYIEHYNDKVALNLYNNKVRKDWQLTEEEFDSLKERYQ